MYIFCSILLCATQFVRIGIQTDFAIQKTASKRIFSQPWPDHHVGTNSVIRCSWAPTNRYLYQTDRSINCRKMDQKWIRNWDQNSQLLLAETVSLPPSTAMPSDTIYPAAVIIYIFSWRSHANMGSKHIASGSTQSAAPIVFSHINQMISNRFQFSWRHLTYVKFLLLKSNPPLIYLLHQKLVNSASNQKMPGYSSILVGTVTDLDSTHT